MDLIVAWLRRPGSTFAAVLLLGLLAFTARPATDPDLWWHLRTGQWIVENHQIPHTDPFSFTRAGSPWISHEWLSELLFFELWEYTGFAGLIIFAAVATTAGFMLLYVRCSAPSHWAAAAVVLGALASAPTWGVRPQMFTFLLASLWLWLLERGEQRRWVLAAIPPIFVLWLNLHAGFALGPALLIAYEIGLSWEVLSGETQWSVASAQFWAILLALAACIALVPLNPSGVQLYRYPFEVLHSATMRSFISEWHSPDFHRRLHLPLLLLNLTLLAVFALRPARLQGRMLVPLFGAFLAALDAVRHIPIFVLLAIPAIAATWPDSMPAWPDLRRKLHPSRSKLVLSASILILMVVLVAAQWIRLEREQDQNEAAVFPALAVAQLTSLPSGARIFAYYDWGGYLVWKLPNSKVFIDGRADLYGDAVFKQFQTIMQISPGWRQTLNEWEVDAVLVPSSALAQALSLDPAWRKQYRDSQAVLYSRRTKTD